MESGLSIAGVGLIIVLVSLFEAGLWADESMDGVEANTFEWAQKRGRQVPARFLRKYGLPGGAAMIVIGLFVAVASLVAG